MRKETIEPKARGDAVLKTLPDALQEQVWQYLRRNTQGNTLAWLKKAHSIKTSPAALSDFWHWYPRTRFVQEAKTASDELAAAVTRLPEMKVTAAQAREIAQANFEILANRNRDPELFAMLSAGEEKRERLRLEREKFEWSKKTEAEKGLDALHAEIKGDAEALRLFQLFRARVLLVQEGKA